MSTRTNSLRRTGTLLAGTAVVAGLFVTGCSNSTSHTAAPKATTAPTITLDMSNMAATTSTTALPTETTVAPPTTHSSHSSHAPATVPATTSPAPATTLGPPPVSVPTPVITVGPIFMPVFFMPVVNTVSAQLHFTCLQAATSGFATQVSWTTNHASSVTVLVNSGLFASGQPTTSNIYVPLSCGTSTTVEVSARWADGTAGGSKTVLIKVDPI